MKKPEFIEMIQESFLSSERKQALIDLLNTKISESIFFETLDRWLVESLANRKELQERMSKQMDESFLKIKAAHKQQRDKQDLALEESIKHIDPTDFLTKKSVMDTYYLERSKEETENEEAIKNVITDILKTVIVELSELEK